MLHAELYHCLSPQQLVLVKNPLVYTKMETNNMNSNICECDADTYKTKEVGDTHGVF